MTGFLVGFFISFLIYLLAEKVYHFSIGYKIIKEKEFEGFIKSCKRTVWSSIVAVAIVSYFAGPLSFLFTAFVTFYFIEFCILDYDLLEINYKEIRNKALSI